MSDVRAMQSSSLTDGRRVLVVRTRLRRDPRFVELCARRDFVEEPADEPQHLLLKCGHGDHLVEDDDRRGELDRRLSLIHI